MRASSRAFSLIELVIVVVILGIIGAIAIPRLSRGAEGAKDAALITDLTALRNAIDLYITEHEGLKPTAGAIADELTQYTDKNGGVSATKDTTHIYGPYIRAIPPLPVGANRGNTGIAAIDGAGVGWIYNATSATIVANASENDATGKAYNTY